MANPKKLPDELKKRLQTQKYEFAGAHTAVKICEWAKRSIKDEDYCYKQKFYGIKSHMCCQMSPAVNFCPHSCIFCWRPIEYNLGTEMLLEDDDVEKLIDNCIKAQRKQLTGFFGNDKANKQKMKEAQNPDMFAISLSGEPTLYPKLGEFIAALYKRKITSFLVTNGCYPEALERLLGKNEPTQLYITLPAPDKETYLKTCKPQLKDSWEKIMDSISLLKKFSCRKTIRLTLVKDLNMIYPEKYAEIISQAGADFIEVKGYVWVGYSRKRLGEKSMPSHNEIVEFGKEICLHSGLKIVDEKPESRVVLLMKEDTRSKIISGFNLSFQFGY
ncbi:MAG: 4-demethylwyosine synthase TYW1 [archaeon]